MSTHSISIASSKDSSESQQQHRSNSIICSEVFEKEDNLSDQDIREYARKIGINVEEEKNLLFIAKEGLQKELPPEWKPCWDDTIQDFYYFNFETGETQWTHPFDEIYKKKVIQARESGSNLSMDLRSGRLMPLPALSKLKPLNGSNPLPPLKKSNPLIKNKALEEKLILRKDNTDDQKDSDSEIIRSIDTLSSGSNSTNNVKGILKIKEGSVSSANLRKELIAKDEKRIMFNLDKMLNLLLIGDDFMERHKLFDINDLKSSNENEDVNFENENMESSGSSSTLNSREKQESRNDQVQYAVKTKHSEPIIKNFGSDVSFSLEKDDIEPQKEDEESSKSILTGNDVLKSIKFPSGTLKELEEKRKLVSESNFNRDIQVALHQVGDPLLKKEEWSSPKIAESRCNVQDEKSSASSSTSSSNPKPKARKRTSHAIEIKKAEYETYEKMRDNLRMTIEKEKFEVENTLKKEFAKNLTDLKELIREGEKLDKQRDLKTKNLKEEFQTNLQTEIAAYRSTLKEEFELEKKNMEKEMKRQYESDISQLKNQIFERIPEPIPPPTKVSNWLGENQSGNKMVHNKPKHKLVQKIDEMKGKLKADFARQVQDLELEIEGLRSKIKTEEIQQNHGSFSKHRPHGFADHEEDYVDPGNSSTDEDLDADYNVNIRKKHHLHIKEKVRIASTPNLDQSSDLDSAVYESSYHVDLNRSLQNLQQRVFSLERCLVPLSQPSYPIQNPIRMLTAQRHLGIGGPTITKTSVVRDRSNLMQGELGPWTIEEQLYKSKMWAEKIEIKKSPLTDLMRSYHY
ncbi:CEP164 [Lepeophtheirus salmonis]|uniref:CEP164 n=1 Tax=Lepeophtheirus salmonis TaxID=72036 RepID=A0A7R8CXP1_LEPSM|nr:CEP164 [Lepeophtheirus salmonis]CAF2933837.1 CEP164 [Lepeophtheirus salmonis]